MISIKQIHYAIAVGQTLHFKQAAEKCNVSQSALSTAIAELESQLKFAIFERDNKKVLITAVGREFLIKAEKIKLQVDDLYLLSKASHSDFGYPMSIGVIPTIGPYLLPKVLPQIRKQYPQLRLTIVEERSEKLIEKVKKGELDTAILALPYHIEGIHAFPFWQEDFYFVSHRSDPTAKQEHISLADIDQHSLMLLEDGHCFKDQVLELCQVSRITKQHSLSGASLYTLVQMVASKMGTTLLPQMALEQLVNHSYELSAIKLKEPGPHRKLVLISRLNYPGVANIEHLINLFKTEIVKPKKTPKSNLNY